MDANKITFKERNPHIRGSGDVSRGRMQVKSGYWKKTVEADGGGLGTVLKIDDEPDENWIFDQIWYTNTSCTIEYFRHVIFIPDDGVVVTHAKEVYDKQSKFSYADGTVHYDSFNDDYCETQPYFYSENFPEVDGKLCYIVGTEFAVRWRDDNEYDPLPPDSHEITEKREWTFSGEVDGGFDLTVFGSSEVSSNIHYFKSRYDNQEYPDDSDNGRERLYICCKTDNKHIYTNVVAFSEPYDASETCTSSNDIPEVMGWSCGHMSGTSTSGGWANMSMSFPTMFDAKGEYFNYAEGMTDPENCTTDNFICYDDYGADEEKVKSILIYADSHFAWVCPSSYKSNITGKSSQDRFLSSAKYKLETTSKEQDGQIWSFTSANVRVTRPHEEKDENGSDGELDPSLAINEIPQHRWVKKFSMREFTNCKDECFPVYLDRNDDLDINGFAKAYGEYARFTGYWEVKQWHEYGSKDVTVVKDRLGHTLTGNQVWYPIFKPWAAANFTLICNEGEKSRTPVPYFLKGLLEKKYHDYCKSVQVWSSDSQDEIAGAIEKYAKTNSPFRVEIYETHGGRREYDKETYLNGKEDDKKYMAKCRLLKWRNPNDRTEMTCITPEEFEATHNTINAWNDNVKWVIQTNACFGSGVGPGIHRSTSGNLVTSPGYAIGGARDMWWSFDACATHCGNTWVYSQPQEDGTRVQESIQKQLIKTYHDGMSYKELTDKINNYNWNKKKITFQWLYTFLNRYKDKIRMCLKGDKREQWDNTISTVLTDLQNQGRTYFCIYDYKKEIRKNGQMIPNPSYYASDSFFDQQTKRYRINDGIIGLLKEKVFEGAATHNPVSLLVDKPPAAELSDYPNALSLDEMLKIIDWYSVSEMLQVLLFGVQSHDEIMRFADSIRSGTIWTVLFNANLIRQTYGKSTLYWYEMQEELGISDEEWSNISGMPLELINETKLVAGYLKEIKGALEILKQNVKNLYDNPNEFGFIPTYIAIYDPIVGCAGDFAKQGTKFMANPDEEEDIWLTSDSDLETMLYDSIFRDS